MSVYGGDSWAREAQYRKRRVDDLAVEGIESSSYRKLSSGKYACLICPHNPVLDTPLMLSVRFPATPNFPFSPSYYYQLLRILFSLAVTSLVAILIFCPMFGFLVTFGCGGKSHLY